MAYVLQDDVHISTLTVSETIMYAAWTRLPEVTIHSPPMYFNFLYLTLKSIGNSQGATTETSGRIVGNDEYESRKR